jgi:hypothetical protein
MDRSLQDIVPIKEKDLEELYPINHIIANNVQGGGGGGEEEKEKEKGSGTATVEGEHVWPFVKQPYWRQHPQVVSGVVLASVTAVAAVSTMVLMKAFSKNR